ncbi:molybdopterin oxidoreductase family protein [Microscilla marina]|uniref:Oxidoreductase, molybdopterin-binding n=1 Tax=Microscilla marina ATCC 23134 TaxID=313606 RepID=A1ZFI0_MICM2|nr:molybdopterin oxidoreductase family protein [Microscilla marina]EAY30754.1 oxidoreductase, molybdopterin-binding [Microscilla marina ATCC 23134]
MPQTHYRTCHLCEAMCGVEITTEANTIVSIKGDKKDPLSAGHICPKAYGLKDVHEDPDRLKQPIKRTAKGWVKISWEEAYAEVVQNIKSIQHTHGKNAVGIYKGNPNVHNLGGQLYGANFSRSIKTKNNFSATSVDQLPHHLASWGMFGHSLLTPIPDINRTDYMLIMGANPLVSNGSLMTAPGFGQRLRALQTRGGKAVVIDPRKTETATKASEHHFIRPGTDAVFLLALLHVIYDENLTNLGKLADIVTHQAIIPELVKAFTPEKTAPITGISAETIRQLACEFAQAKTAVAYGRMGLSTQAFGGVCQWLINVLNIVTGNFDQPGGAMFTTPAIDVVGLLGAIGATGSLGRWKSRVRALPEFGGELPVCTLAEEILTEGEGQIKAMVTIAGNPVLSTPNGTQLNQAFAQLDFMVAIDIYLNETTRHAHIILPPATGLESEHYDLIFHSFAVHNTAKFSSRLFDPVPEAKHDWEILQDLANLLNGEPSTPQEKEKQQKNLFGRLSPEAILDLALRTGRYGSKYHKGSNGLNLQKLRAQPHGVDLGPLQPSLPKRLYTKNKQIILAPELFIQDLKRVEKVFWNEAKTPDQQFDLYLIGRRQLRGNNSWMHNSERLTKGSNRCTMHMHPQDAQKRRLQQGQMATVSSRVGNIDIQVEITDQMMPGVVSIPHGWGHHYSDIRLQTAQQRPGVSINDLTDELLIDELSGNAAFSGVPVKVE